MIKKKIVKKRKVGGGLLKSRRKIYDLWEQYDRFIRFLNVERQIQKKVTKLEKIRIFLKKGVVIAFGSFFTTATFHFLVKPSGIYNPGLNGFLSKIAEWKTGGKKEPDFYTYYYSSSSIINILIIFFLWFFYQADLGVISTAVIYNFFQIVWTSIFEKYANGFFVFFDSDSWEKIKLNDQKLAFLPQLVVIAVLAAIFHTYGYSLIFRSRSTPGGLEIISAHFSVHPQSKVSISTLIKHFSFLILFSSTLFEFLVIKKESGIIEYFKFLSKEGEFLATIIYIFVSSILMNRLFPREQIVFCQVYSLNEKSRNQALYLLKKHSPTHYSVYQKQSIEDKIIYVTSCYLSRWNYFLLEPDLKETGKIFINETN